MLRALSTCFVDKRQDGKDAQGKVLPVSKFGKKVHVSPSDLSFQVATSPLHVPTPDFKRGEEKMSGHVYERRGHTWKHAFLRLDSGYLSCFAGKEPGASCKMLPLHICMVRPLKKSRFRVICATQYSLTFKAKDVSTMRKWVAEIQSAIAESLSAQASPASCSSGKDMLALLRKSSVSNRYCADCGAPDPTWVSVSIGALLCIECSGVHRSMGTHISKVRSFELDLWGENTEMVEKIGNADVNSVFEAAVPISRQKPDPSSDRESREKWIIDKYVHKKFVKRFATPVPTPISSPACSPAPSPAASRTLSRKPSANLAEKLPPGFASPGEIRPRTPDFIPTSHIGSNIFAKKTPYGPGVRTERRGSFSAVLDKTPYRVTARRNSMHPRIA